MRHNHALHRLTTAHMIQDMICFAGPTCWDECDCVPFVVFACFMGSACVYVYVRGVRLASLLLN